jgi:hypothetical protein
MIEAPNRPDLNCTEPRFGSVRSLDEIHIDLGAYGAYRVLKSAP